MMPGWSALLPVRCCRLLPLSIAGRFSVRIIKFSTESSESGYPVNRNTTTKPNYYEGKGQKSELVVLPPQIPSSAFIDASSPDAWAPRPVSQPVSVPLAVSPSVEDLSPSSSPVKRQDIESELNKQNLYKTELCRNWVSTTLIPDLHLQLETGQCRYGTRCQFAHGEHEIRDVLRHPKYKTEICRTFHTTGTCSYGKRCRFVHHPAEMRLQDGQESIALFNQQIALLKMSAVVLTSSVPQPQPQPKTHPVAPLRLTGSAEYASTSSDYPSPPKSPSRTANTSSASAPPSPMKVAVVKTQEEEAEEVPPAATVASDATSASSEEFPASDSSLKKSSAYRLPFFAKLHSWKKK